MNRWRQALAVLGVVSLLLVSAVCGHVVSFIYRPLPLSEPYYYVLARGRPCVSVAWDLYRAHIFRHRWEPKYFVWWASLHRAESSLKAGEYELTSAMTPADVLDHLTQGKRVRRFFTIKEGWQWHDLASALLQESALDQSPASREQAGLLPPMGDNPGRWEGIFFPDTYEITRGSPLSDVLNEAFQKQNRVMAEEWPLRDPNLPFSNYYEALTVASLIEKETGLASEREKISGVIVRRLRAGMRLQIDASVRYGRGEAGRGVLSYEHLREDTPYNTYTRSGLPPTPIAYPSRASVHAALHPDQGNALFYVSLEDGSGAHVFSATFEEHRQYIAERNRRRKENEKTAFRFSRVSIPSVA